MEENEENYGNREHKDRFFKKIFSTKGALLHLYNAVNGTKEEPDRKVIKLSDAFKGCGRFSWLIGWRRADSRAISG